MRGRSLAASVVVGAVLCSVSAACQGRVTPNAAMSSGARPVGPAALSGAAADGQGFAARPLPAQDLKDLKDAKVVTTPGGIVVPVLEFGYQGWKVSTPCGREAVVARATPVREATVVLDPGHGGYDPGAIGPNGLSEASLNLAVSRHAREALEREGVSVVLTRDGEHGMNLTNRARLAVSLGAKAFVSVHHNAASWAPSDVPGSEAYYQMLSEDSKRLAGLIYEEVVAALTPYAARWVTAGTGVTYRTRARDGDDYFAMVRQPKGVPSTLVELAFLSNPAEAALLAREDVQRTEGEAVARGILRYLTTDDPGSGYLPGGQMAPRPRPPGGGGGEDPCDDPPL